MILLVKTKNTAHISNPIGKKRRRKKKEFAAFNFVYLFIRFCILDDKMKAEIK